MTDAALGEVFDAVIAFIGILSPDGTLTDIITVNVTGPAGAGS